MKAYTTETLAINYLIGRDLMGLLDLKEIEELLQPCLSALYFIYSVVAF